MFAVDERTVHALNVLNQMLGREWQSREADKDRGLKIAAMKIESDERELTRLNQYVVGLEKQQEEMEKEWRNLTGLEARLAKNEEDTGVVGTDAQGIVGRKKTNLAVSREGVDKRIADVNSRREQLAVDRSTWAKTIYDIAPEAYDKYRGKDYKIDAAEWDQMTKDYGLAGVDTRTGDVMTAGLRRAFEAMEAEQYAKDQAAQKMRLEERKVVTDEFEAQTDYQYKMGLLGLRQQEMAIDFATKAGKTKPDKVAIDQYKQWRDAVIGYGKTREMDIDKIATMPDVLSSAQDFGKARQAVAMEVGERVADDIDFFFVPDELEGFVDEYKDASTIKAKAEAGAKIARFLRNYGDTKDIMSDSEAEYVDMVLEGYDILNRAQSKIEQKLTDPKEFQKSVDELAGVSPDSAAALDSAAIDSLGSLLAPLTAEEDSARKAYNLEQINTMVKRDSLRTEEMLDWLSKDFQKWMDQGKVKSVRGGTKFYSKPGSMK